MRIEAIKLKNFKAFKQVEISNMPNLCVFIGANGTGKTTLFSVFDFLQKAMSDNVNSALRQLGGPRGFEEVRTRNAKGPIEIEIKFREKKDDGIRT